MSQRNPGIVGGNPFKLARRRGIHQVAGAMGLQLG